MGRAGRWEPADPGRSKLYWIYLIVVWFYGLWVYGWFYPNCEFYCMQILSQSNQQQAEDSAPFIQASGSRSAASVSLSDVNRPSFSLLRLPARLPRR